MQGEKVSFVYKSHNQVKELASLWKHKLDALDALFFMNFL